jgi:hypothetical protein
MPGGVFISYRREDTAGVAGRIYDRLVSRLGEGRVFFDIDNIRLGRDFVDILSLNLDACDALVAVIGRSWVSSVDKDNRRRLDDPNDYVRIEVESALSLNIAVIPVFVDGASMPELGELPDSLAKLRRRHGIEVSHTRFNFDVDRLCRELALIEQEDRERKLIEAEELQKCKAEPYRAEQKAAEKEEERESAASIEQVPMARASNQRVDEVSVLAPPGLG